MPLSPYRYPKYNSNKLTLFSTVGVNNWVTAWGPARVFDTIGGIEVALFFLSIPVWAFGKQWRAYFHFKHIS
jgi:hypothetical protein